MKRLFNPCPAAVVAVMLWSMARAMFLELLETRKAECTVLMWSMAAAAALAHRRDGLRAIRAMAPRGE